MSVCETALDVMGDLLTEAASVVCARVQLPVESEGWFRGHFRLTPSEMAWHIRSAQRMSAKHNV